MEAAGGPAAYDPFWREVPAAGTRAELASRSGPWPARFRISRVDLTRLSARLATAASSPVTRDGGEITLPLPDGRLEPFRVVESPIFGPEMIREHPGLETYLTVGARDSRIQGRIDLTVLGLRAIVFPPEGTALIDPVDFGRTNRVMSYWSRDDASAGSFACETDISWSSAAQRHGRAHASAGDLSRTYRFILVATGEYTQALGGVTQATAQMATSMNRIDAILERDVAVHLQVEHLLAFDDPATDPFYQFSVGQLLTRNRQVVDSLYGFDAYDMHQVVHVRSGYRGVAYRPFACDSSYKGESAVYGEDPTTDKFDIKVMAQEIGHTLGATHSQDGGSNRSTSPLTTYEPSEGWTIMASPGHPASFGDAYYHFVLTGSGSDPDAGDALTYTWEEVDASSSAYDPVC